MNKRLSDAHIYYSNEDLKVGDIVKLNTSGTINLYIPLTKIFKDNPTEDKNTINDNIITYKYDKDKEKITLFINDSPKMIVDYVITDDVKLVMLYDNTFILAYGNCKLLLLYSNDIYIASKYIDIHSTGCLYLDKNISIDKTIYDSINVSLLSIENEIKLMHRYKFNNKMTFVKYHDNILYCKDDVYVISYDDKIRVLFHSHVDGDAFYQYDDEPFGIVSEVISGGKYSIKIKGEIFTSNKLQLTISKKVYISSGTFPFNLSSDGYKCIGMMIAKDKLLL